MATDHRQPCPPPSSSPASQDGELGTSSASDGQLAASPVESPPLVWPVLWDHGRRLTPANFYVARWDPISEKLLEDLLISHMVSILRIAVRKIASFGYTEMAATEAVLRCGLGYDMKDTAAKIVDLALALLRADSTAASSSPSSSSSSLSSLFKDLEDMGRYVVAEIVCVLRMVWPSFNMADAMWWLLLCDLNLSEACGAAMNSSFSPAGPNSNTLLTPVMNSAETAEMTRRPHEQNEEDEPPSSSSSSSSDRHYGKRSISSSSSSSSAPSAVSRRRDPHGSTNGGGSSQWSTGEGGGVFICQQIQIGRFLTVRFSKLPAADPLKKEQGRVISAMIRLLERLDEWAEWGQLKVVQATYRLSRDKEELRRLKREAAIQLDSVASTERRILSMETALQETHKRVGQCNEKKRRLEEENAQLRREIKAAAGGGGGGDGGGRWVREERAALKKALGMERRRVAQLRREISQTVEHCRRLEARRREEESSKAEIIHRVATEREVREWLQSSWRFEEEVARFQSEKELRRFAREIRRLEEEISRLKLGEVAAPPALERMIEENQVEGQWACAMCQREEASVVFLPCAHEVLCKRCSGARGAKGNKHCPSCGARIDERVNVRLRDE